MKAGAGRIHNNIHMFTNTLVVSLLVLDTGVDTGGVWNTDIIWC